MYYFNLLSRKTNKKKSTETHRCLVLSLHLQVALFLPPRALSHTPHHQILQSEKNVRVYECIQYRVPVIVRLSREHTMRLCFSL